MSLVEQGRGVFQEPVRVPGQFWPQQELYRRPVPRGIPGFVLIGVGTLVTIVGHWILVRGYTKREKQEAYIADARRNIAPYLHAEQDISYMAATKKKLEDEEKYCKDLPGWTVGGGVYNTTWMYPVERAAWNW